MKKILLTLLFITSYITIYNSDKNNLLERQIQAVTGTIRIFENQKLELIALRGDGVNLALLDQKSMIILPEDPAFNRIIKLFAGTYRTEKNELFDFEIHNQNWKFVLHTRQQ